MSYRNGTYIAFHAGGTTDPTASDIKYYRMLKAWHENDDIEFRIINSHEKVSAVRDSSAKLTLQRSLRERLNNSKNMVLIVGQTTRLDSDWVPFEIMHAIDVCEIPLIVTYTNAQTVLNPSAYRPLWPAALAQRIDNKTAKAIHIPFKRDLLDMAIRQFNLSNLPRGPLSYYSEQAHRQAGLIA